MSKRKVPHQYATFVLTKNCFKCHAQAVPFGGIISKKHGGWVCHVCSGLAMKPIVGPGLSYDNRYQCGPREQVSKHFRAYPPGIDPLTGAPWK
jgi:hypothetical protein